MVFSQVNIARISSPSNYSQQVKFQIPGMGICISMVMPWRIKEPNRNHASRRAVFLARRCQICLKFKLLWGGRVEFRTFIPYLKMLPTLAPMGAFQLVLDICHPILNAATEVVTRQGYKQTGTKIFKELACSRLKGMHPRQMYRAN